MQPTNVQQALDFLYVVTGKAQLTRDEHLAVEKACKDLKDFIDSTNKPTIPPPPAMDATVLPIKKQK